ncbi:MAG: DNA polymerase IV, partial [Calditrichaeota bacterium]|nr:DNA polymerase IV [Calditrichota bacterium]
EQRDNPSLIGKPVIIGPNPNKGEMRGVVSTCSYEARPYGVHSAMPISTAFKLCPQAVFLPGNFKKYHEVSSQLMEIMQSFSPLIEPLSLDEAFLDISGSQELFGDGQEIARKLQIAVYQKLNLTCSIGVAPVKFVAKIASDFKKPNGITIIEPGHVQDFLDPLDLKRLWGLGKRSLEQFHRMGLSTVRDLRLFSQETIRKRFGKSGQHFINLANGIDARSVSVGHQRKSISKERTFSSDVDDIELIHKVLYRLSEDLTEAVRLEGFLGQTVGLKFRETGFVTHNRQMTITHPVLNAVELYRLIESLLAEFLPLKKKVRLLGISISSQRNADQQVQLFDDPRKSKLDEVRDQLNKRYGHSTVKGAEGL